MPDEDYNAFIICFGTKILECEDCYLGIWFVDVHHDMFNRTDGNNYLGDYFIFIHNFYLYIVALKLTLNNKNHGSEYYTEILEDSLKADYHFDFPNNAKTFVSNTTNDATKVADYLSEDAKKVNLEMYQLNSAMKYGFGPLENKILTIAVDGNGIQMNKSNSKWKCEYEIVNLGGAFLQRKELIQKMTSTETYFDQLHCFQRLNNVQEYNNVPVGYTSFPETTHVSSVHNLMTHSILFYLSLKRFYDETKDTKEDKEFV